MSKAYVTATWDDAPHLSEQSKKELFSQIPAYQRDARTKGIPQLGSGAIYPIPETELLVKPFELPSHWPRAYALDVGWNRTAALHGAHDKASDTLYLYSEYYAGHAEPSTHATGIRAKGEWIPGFIDPAARGRSQHDGRRLSESYKNLGLKLEPAKNAVETGLNETFLRLSTGRLKVFNYLNYWLEEFRLYQRDKNGHVVKEFDHLMDCMRYLVMALIDGKFELQPFVQNPKLAADVVVDQYGQLGSAQGWMG